MLFLLSADTGCSLFSGWMIDQSLRHQHALNEKARLVVNTNIRDKIHVGDDQLVAEQVLSKAELSYVVDIRFDHAIVALYSTGKGCGFSIKIFLDEAKKVSAVKIQEVLTGP